MKKRIIIVSHNMKLGGIEKSLLGLLQTINYDMYEVDLFLFEQTGDFLKYIPKEVSLIPEIPYYAHIIRDIKHSINPKFFGIFLSKIYSRLKTKKYFKNNNHQVNDVSINYLYGYANKFAPMISEKEYDVAISFSDVHYAAINKVRAKKKCCWIHTDYSIVSQDKNYCEKMWASYDAIVAVSHDAKKSFIVSYPNLRERVTVIENIVPKEYIISETKAFDVSEEIKEDTSIKLLTVGRFSYAKRMDEIPTITKKILELGANITWYLIGFGSDEDLIRKKITEEDMKDHVIILGKKSNPYPYFKACDYYVQPSRYEGKSVTVREAQTLGKPVIITNYPTASSQLEDGVDGVIVPMELDACAKRIAEVITDESLKAHLTEEISKRDYSNSSEIEKINIMINKI